MRFAALRLARGMLYIGCRPTFQEASMNQTETDTLMHARLIDSNAVLVIASDNSWTIEYSGYIDFYGSDGKLMAHLLA